MILSFGGKLKQENKKELDRSIIVFVYKGIYMKNLSYNNNNKHTKNIKPIQMENNISYYTDSNTKSIVQYHFVIKNKI